VPKWTVMIFMGADGVEGNKPLKDEALADLAELTAVDASKDLAIFVEIYGAGAPTRHYRVGAGQWVVQEQSGLSPQDFTNGIALTRFIDDALNTAGHGPTDYSMLVLWGHAYRFAIGHTETQTGLDALDFAELALVLRRFQERKQKEYEAGTTAGGSNAAETSTERGNRARPTTWREKQPSPVDPPKLDIVAFDACAIATIEMAYQLAPYAKYMIASQVTIPLPGWPYHKILKRLADPKGNLMEPAELGSYAVRRFSEHYRAHERAVTLSYLDLSHAGGLFRLTDALARKLAIALDGDADEVAVVSRLFELAQTEDGDPFVDVVMLCRFLMNYSNDAAVRLAARELADALLSLPMVGTEVTTRAKPFIVENGLNSALAAGLHGVSLYAPNVAPGHDFGSASHFYEKFAFGRETLWRELVRALSLPN
jgi:hypothetical protein